MQIPPRAADNENNVIKLGRVILFVRIELTLARTLARDIFAYAQWRRKIHNITLQGVEAGTVEVVWGRNVLIYLGSSA